MKEVEVRWLSIEKRKKRLLNPANASVADGKSKQNCAYYYYY